MPRAFALLFFGCLGLVLPGERRGPNVLHGRCSVSDPAPIVAPGAKATLLPDGSAAAPADAPPQVQAAIFAANKLLGKPYKYGGGHAKVKDSGYDCSGTVSYALLAAKLLKSPLDSSSFMRWGLRGKGAWITVYTNPGHAFAVIAGLRLDTSTGGIRAARSRAPPSAARAGASRCATRAASRRATRSGSSPSGRRARLGPLDLVALGEPVAAARLRLALAPLLVVASRPPAAGPRSGGRRRRARPS